MTALIDMMIGSEVMGHQQNLLNAQGPQYEVHANLVAPPQSPADIDTMLTVRGYPQGEGYVSIDELIDRENVGNIGGNLDGFTPTIKNGPPGFGAYNDQPMQSGPTNMGGKTVPSEEAGTGKPWGPVAHMPVAQGGNDPRFNYAFAGQFGDGQEYFPATGPVRTRQMDRSAIHDMALHIPSQQPFRMRFSKWLGSTTWEVPPTMSLSEALGRHVEQHGPSWGIQ